MSSARRSSVASPKWNTGSTGSMGGAASAPGTAALLRAAAAAPPAMMMLRKGHKHITCSRAGPK